MANTKSAKKRTLIGERNRLRNQASKTKLKNMLRKFELATLKPEEAKVHLNQYFTALDRCSEQVIHPNKASRLKARAAKMTKAICLAA